MKGRGKRPVVQGEARAVQRARHPTVCRLIESRSLEGERALRLHGRGKAMGWDVRTSGRRYYYRSRRPDGGGQPRRQYLGTGPEAEMAAAEDAQRRDERQAEQEARRAERARLQAADATLSEYIGQ